MESSKKTANNASLMSVDIISLPSVKLLHTHEMLRTFFSPVLVCTALEVVLHVKMSCQLTICG